MTEILLEKKLTTDFTMGFELEAIWNEGEGYETSEYDRDIYKFFNKYFPNGDLHSDGSLDTDDGRGTPFEWSSPVLKVNASTFKKIIDMFKEGLPDYFYVNSSCGFHHHITFEGITAEEMVWIMCKLALDENMKNKLKEFDDYNFVTGWSQADYLDKLKTAVENDDYKEIVEICNTHKYSLINVHPQGTLEWRGPRGFLDEVGTADYAERILTDFYVRVWEFVKWITDVLDETEINNISKENFYDGIRTAMKSSNTTRIKGFDKKEEHKSGILSDKKLEDVCREISNNPKILLKYINSDVLEQIIQKLYNKNRLGTKIKAINEMEEVSQDIKDKLNNLAYKYIPYRILKNYDVKSDTIYNTSPMTMKRLINTKKLDGEDVTPSDVLDIIEQNLNLFNPKILAKTKCPIIYDSNISVFDRNNIFKFLVTNNYIKDVSANTLLASINGLNLDNEADKIKLDLIIKVLKDKDEKPLLKKLSNNLFNLCLDYPTVVCKYIKLNRKQIIYLIDKIKNEGTMDKLNELRDALIKEHYLTQEEWDELNLFTKRNTASSISDVSELQYDDEEIK